MQKIIEVRKDGCVYQVFCEGVDLPDERTIKSMKEAGYRLYQDGKLYKKQK